MFAEQQHRMLLQLDNPEEAAKVKIPTGKKVEQLNG